MKAIMLSVRPEWLAKILKGKKTIEIRKSVPKYFKGWVYLYCTKGKPYLLKRDFNVLNGKVVARFWFDEISKYTMGETNELYVHDCDEYNISYYELENACLDYWELCDYGKDKPLYGWHIKKLEVFDTPKGLNEFERRYAPQSWCYVEIKEVIENDN